MNEQHTELTIRTSEECAQLLTECVELGNEAGINFLLMCLKDGLNKYTQQVDKPLEIDTNGHKFRTKEDTMRWERLTRPLPERDDTPGSIYMNQVNAYPPHERHADMTAENAFRSKHNLSKGNEY